MLKSFDHQLDLIQSLVDSILMVVLLIIIVQIYPDSPAWNDKYTIVAGSSVIFFFIGAKVNSLYRSYRIGGVITEVRPLMVTWTVTVLGLLLLGYSFKSTHELSRVVLGTWVLSVPIVLLFFRGILRHALDKIRSTGRNTRTVMIVGVDDNAQALAKNIINMPWMGLKLDGFISEDHSGVVYEQDGQEWVVKGGMEFLYTAARENRIDSVYLAIPMRKITMLDEIIKRLGDSTVSIFLVPDFYTAEFMQGSWHAIGDMPTVSVIDGPMQGIDSWLKRFEDIVLSSLALVVLAVPMAVIGLAVKLTSPGPVLFKQERYGMNGHAILVWKFRSMTVTENGHDFVQATKNDARVTPLGRLLRKTSLDELPQFFNVLSGCMSIVGPRPHAVAHNEEFRGKINGYMMRHKVKPGITGLAQINGCRGETDTNEKMEMRVRYDVDYICNWSIWLDIAIILKTPLVLIRNEDVY